jgi:hypothetical protein
LVFTAIVCMAAAPAAMLGGLAPGDVGDGFVQLGTMLAAIGGGAGLFWALRAQLKMPKYASAGIAHTLIFTGFATLLLRTIILVGRGFDESFYLFILDPQGPDPVLRAMGFGYNLLKDFVVLGVLAGVGAFFYFRLVPKLKRLSYSWHAWVVLGVIGTMMVMDILADGGMVLAHAIREGGDVGVNIGHIGNTTGENLGRVLALILHGVGVSSYATAHTLGAVGLWVHVFLVFAFLNYLPYGKHFHVLTALPNVFARSLDAPGRLKPMAASSDLLLESLGAAMEQPDPTAARVGVGRMDHGVRPLFGQLPCAHHGQAALTEAPPHRPPRPALREAGRGLFPRSVRRGWGSTEAHLRPQPRPRRDSPRRHLGVHHLPRLRRAVPCDDHVRRQDR